MSMRLSTITFDSKSDFQTAQVVKTVPFGKTLVLDGKTQSAQFDEAIYHESLVHPAMLLHENPKSVYIGGGGEFATAREVLKHASVESCVMVDIDEVVCNICKEQLPEWGAGAWDDKRMEVHYDDAKAFLERDSRTYDVIIMDIADPIEAGPG
jgi:spermidine synthase